MFYVDTSLIVSALTAEAEGERVRVWLVGSQAGELYISDWVVTEFSSALSLKLRTGQISSDVRDSALAEFREAAVASFIRLEISRSHFQSAASFADRYKLGLRAADALHLAIAVDFGLSLCTLDKRLAAAAQQLGYATFEV